MWCVIKDRGYFTLLDKYVCASLIVYGPCHHGIRLWILTPRVFSSVWGQISVCIFLLKHWNLHLYNQGHISTVPYLILHFTVNCYLIFFHTALILFLITDEWMSEFVDPCIWVFHHREVYLSVISGIGILMISACCPQYLYKIKILQIEIGST